MSSTLATPPTSPSDTTKSDAPHRILIVGGAYAGIAAVVTMLGLAKGEKQRDSFMKIPDLKGEKSRRGVRVSLLDERDGFFHSVGAPLAHVTHAHSSSMWRTYASMLALRPDQHPNLHFLHGSLQEITPSTRTATYLTPSGHEVHEPYDYIVCATGYKRAFPTIPNARTKKEYMAHASAHIEAIAKARDGRVVVIGGGAVGIEFAGEIAVNHPEVKVVLIHSRNELLSAEDLGADFKLKALEVLREEGVEVVLGNRAKVEEREGGGYTVTLADGKVIEAGHVIDATGKSVPSTNYLPPETLNGAGYAVVTPQLTLSPKLPHPSRHYAIGDVCKWSGIKRAGTALGMGHMVSHNIMREILTDEGLEITDPAAEFPEVPPMMGLAIGTQCVSWYPNTKEMKWGKDEMKYIFSDDLGWEGCLGVVGLTEFDDVDA